MKKFLFILLPFILVSCGDSSSSSDDKIGVTAYLKITSSLDASAKGQMYNVANTDYYTNALATCAGKDDNSIKYVHVAGATTTTDASLTATVVENYTTLWRASISVPKLNFLSAAKKMEALLCDYLKNHPETAYDGVIEL